MEIGEKEKLQHAIRVLWEYDLWRKGFIESLSFTPAEIGAALGKAMAAILDYIKCDAELSVTDSSLKMAECELERSHNELRRLRAMLAAHKIRYGRKKK